MATLSSTHPTSSSRSGISLLKLAALGVAGVLAIPVLIILINIFIGGSDVWQHLYDTLLFDYVSNSLLLMVGVTLGTLVMGVPAAWLTSVCDFPGRSVLSWALLLPLAMPAYIIAYTYTGIRQAINANSA